MENLVSPLIKVDALQQVGYVVRDADKVMKNMWETFGIGPWDVYVTTEDLMSKTTYYGKPAKFSFKAAMCQLSPNGMQIELIEPLSGDNIYQDHINQFGEGIQHLGWYKVYSLNAFQETKQALEKAGFPCAMGGEMYSNTKERDYIGTWGYFDTRKVLNAMLEVLEITSYDPATATNPPTYVYPAK